MCFKRGKLDLLLESCKCYFCNILLDFCGSAFVYLRFLVLNQLNRVNLDGIARKKYTFLSSCESKPDRRRLCEPLLDMRGFNVLYKKCCGLFLKSLNGLCFVFAIKKKRAPWHRGTMPAL